MKENRIYIQNIKNHKIKNNLKNLFYKSIHLRNLLILTIKECGFEILNKNVLTKIFTKKLRKELKEYEKEKLNKIKNSKYYNDLIKVSENIPSGLIQQIILQLLKDYKSYFASLKSYNKNKEKFRNKPKPPKARKINNIDFFSLLFTSQTFTQKENKIFLTGFKKKKLKCKIPKHFNQKITSVRIVKKYDNYELHCIYQIEIPDLQDFDIKETKYVTSIDLGLNNLATLFTNNENVESLIISGKQIKSFNQWFNKKKAELQSKINKEENNKTKNELKNKLRKLLRHRERKLKSWFHLISTRIVDYCLISQSKYVIISKNILESKNEINLGKRNNQNFVFISFSILINQLEYKLKQKGIKLIFIDESYTSKCDSLTNEIIEIMSLNKQQKKQFNFKGKRIKRGLFKHYNGIQSNADVNGSINIAKKFKVDILNNLNEKILKRKICRPRKITLFQLQNANQFCNKMLLTGISNVQLGLIGQWLNHQNIKSFV